MQKPPVYSSGQTNVLVQVRSHIRAPRGRLYQQNMLPWSEWFFADSVLLVLVLSAPLTNTLNNNFNPINNSNVGGHTTIGGGSVVFCRSHRYHSQRTNTHCLLVLVHSGILV